MSSSIFLGLVNNAALLLALVLLYDMLPLMRRMKIRWVQEVLTGIGLGLIGITVMVTPWKLAPGVSFDTRSVLLGISGLFFGTIPTLVAILMTGGLRLYQGGAGVVMGVAVIFSSALTGVFWRYLRTRNLINISWKELYALGLVVHGLMLVCTLLLPQSMAANVRAVITLPVMVIYPIGTMLLGLLLTRRLLRQQTAEVLAKSEERYRTTLMSIGDGVITADAQGRIEMMNPVSEMLTGWTQAEARGKPLAEVFRIINENTRQTVENPVAHVLRTGSKVSLANHTLLIARDGFERPIADSGAPIMNANGEIIGVVLVFRDQTQERAVLKALHDSEAKYRLISENAGDVIWTLDPATQSFTYASPSVKKMLGFTPEEMFQRNLQMTLTPGSYSEISKTLPARLAKFAEGEDSLRIQTTELDQIHKDGSIVPTEVVTTLLNDRYGKVTSILGVARDIAERRRTEEERKATIDLLRLMNASADQHELIHEVITYFKNWAKCEAVGIRLKEGDDYPYYESSGFSEQFLRSENRICDYKNNGEVERDSTGNPVLECMCGTVIRGRFNPSKPFFSANGSFWTNSTTQLLNYTTEADRQSRTRNRCHGEGYESVALIPLRSGNETLGLIQLNDMKKGHFTPELINLYERLAGNVANALSKKKVEKELRASRERFRALYEYSSVPILEEDLSGVKTYLDHLRAQGVTEFREYFAGHPDEVVFCASQVKILDVNVEGLRLYNARCKEDLFRSLPDFYIDSSWDSFREELAFLAEGNTIYTGELPIRVLNGEQKLLSLHLSVVPGCEETLSQVLISFWDLTERKQAEAKLKTTLAERETLLRELYHRTKNNMQVIRSMLVLQSANSTSKEVQKLVKETDNKIQAMALVHQMLYQSQNLSSINLQTYIQALANLTLESYGVPKGQVTLNLSLEPLLVTIDIATPLGLILNELLSNASKHAFPNNRQGEINISLSREEDGLIRLEFADNGIGLPKGFDLRQQTTYGMLSVFGLAEIQLSGQVQVDTSHGLFYQFQFPDGQYQTRI